MNFSRQQRIIDHFRRSLDSYDSGAVVQKEVSDELVQALAQQGRAAFTRAVEIGCCTGSLTECLCRRFDIGTLWVNDLVRECCQRTLQRIDGLSMESVEFSGDIEALTLPADLDLIASSSTFQWLLDLPGFLKRCSTALKEDGILAFTMFGPGTMSQLRQLIGIGLDYKDPIEIHEMLIKNFLVLDVRNDRRTIYFPNARSVLRHIQLTGVGGAGCYTWTPSRLKRFEQEYQERFATDQGLPLDFVSIRFIARKKGARQ